VIALLRHFRALAGVYALAAAVCQVAVLSSTTMVLAASPQYSAVTVAADEECSCDHSSGVMCPMHQRSTSRPGPANGPRWCKGVDGSSYAVLPVLGTLALPERVAPPLHSIVESAAPVPRAAAPRLLVRPPDSPPPRV